MSKFVTVKARTTAENKKPSEVVTKYYEITNNRAVEVFFVGYDDSWVGYGDEGLVMPGAYNSTGDSV